MKELDRFNINIYSLALGRHDYQFEIGNSFFEAVPETIVNEGSGKVDVELYKNERLIELTFHLDVQVELECDRSLEKFYFPISERKRLILKYGDEEQELDDEIIVILRDKQQINLHQYIYEFIGLAIPMKKLHPRFDNDSEEDEIVYDSKDHSEDNEEAIDPRWSKLKDLKKD